MVTHATVGNELGFFVRVDDVIDEWTDGGASATIDGLDQLISEAEATFDADATSKEFLPQVIGMLNAIKADVGSVIKPKVYSVFRDWCFQRLRGELNSSATKVRNILADLALAMDADSKVVKSCGVSVGAASNGNRNTSDYEIIAEEIGPNSWALNNENIQSQDFQVVCRADSETGGTTEFKERFTVSANITGQEQDCYAVMVPGTCSNYENRLQNKDGVTGGATSNSNADTTIPFENFTGSVPDCWQLVTGTATTHITSESATANVLFGSYSLEFAGDGSTKTKIKIAGADLYGSTQTDFNLYPGEKYLIGTWMKSDAAISAGTFEMYMDGTGYSAETAEKAVKDLSSSPPTSWTFYHGVVRMPKSIPSDVEVYMEWTTALENGKKAYVDGPVFARMRYYEDAGIMFAIVPKGSAHAIAGDVEPDYYEFSTTNSESGLIQTFMTARTDISDPLPTRRPDLQVYLPHGATASSEYAESKAQ